MLWVSGIHQVGILVGSEFDAVFRRTSVGGCGIRPTPGAKSDDRTANPKLQYITGCAQMWGGRCYVRGGRCSLPRYTAIPGDHPLPKKAN